VFKIVLLPAMLWFALASHAARAADLTITVTGLESDQGDVHIAVYDRPEAFPKSGGMLAEGVQGPDARNLRRRDVP